MSGDFAALYDDDMEMALVVNADGTGTFTFGGEAAPFTWTEKSPTAITLEIQTTSDDSASDSSASASASAAAAETTTVDVTCEDGALFMEMQSDDYTGTVIFTADGTFAGAKEISIASAKPITSEDALVGTWKLSGLNMMGINMYGDADALAAMAGSEDMTVTFEKGGKATMSGSDMTYTVGADGAAIDESGVTLPILALGDDVIIDLSDVLGMEMVMLLSK